MYHYFVMTHSGAMSSALVLLVVCEVLLVAARSRGHMRLVSMALKSSKISGYFVLVGLIAGIALVVLGGWSLIAPWLLISFFLIACLIAVESAFISPWQEKLKQMIGSDCRTSDLSVLLKSPRAQTSRAAMILIFVLIFVLMTTKPWS